MRKKALQKLQQDRYRLRVAAKMDAEHALSQPLAGREEIRRAIVKRHQQTVAAIEKTYRRRANS